MGSGQIHDDHPNHHFFTPDGRLVSTKRLVYIIDQEDGLQRVRIQIRIPTYIIPNRTANWIVMFSNFQLRYSGGDVMNITKAIL